MREAIRFLREDAYLTLLLIGGEGFVGELNEEELLTALADGNYDLPLRELIPAP